jgi:hypothetical protein
MRMSSTQLQHRFGCDEGLPGRSLQKAAKAGTSKRRVQMAERMGAGRHTRLCVCSLGTSLSSVAMMRAGRACVPSWPAHNAAAPITTGHLGYSSTAICAPAWHMRPQEGACTGLAEGLHKCQRQWDVAIHSRVADRFGQTCSIYI